MKKLNQYALLSAMMLTGAVGFTACSSDNDPAGDVNIGNGEVVKTQFAINIPYAGKGNTRMSDDIVQGQTDPEFRGMQNIRLMPLALTGTVGNGATGSENVNGSTIILANIGKEGDLSVTSAKYKVYSNVGIPVETNAFLFYGEALSESSDAAENGKLVTTPDFSTTVEENYVLGNIKFSLQPFVTSATDTRITNAENFLLGILNGIAGAEGWSTTQNETIKVLYNQFISLQAGSANSILLTVQELYNKLNNITDETIKGKIQDKIKESFTPTGDIPNATLAYITKTYETYPTNLGLPCGAVRVLWETNQFSYVHPEGGQNPFNVTDLSAYTYPSALFYMANTTIKTSNSIQSNNYKGRDEWTGAGGILELYTNGEKVTNDTRSVALVDPINYAVGRFDVKAKFSTSTPLDKEHKVVNLDDDSFKLTGVLIGGQKSVNWDFLPIKSEEENTIFDTKLIKADINTKDNDIQNKTLVLASAEKTSVHFALELKNNTNQAFQGADGIVHADATFYLIGKLDPDMETGEGKHISVFEKDHFTTATVTINSLTNAYNCVPDLRTPKLELGLSVDLEWQEGLSKDVTIE